MIIEGVYFSDVYYKLLDQIYNRPSYENSPRGLKQKELTNVELKLIVPENNLFKNEIRSPNLNYLYGELYWYFSGSNKLNDISKYSKFWNNISNDDGTVNSAYGHLLFKDRNEHGITEWGWALNSLIKDKDTRQAIIRFNKPKHSYHNNKDFVCTLTGIFQIRNNCLNFTTTMRSQDMWYGLPYDMPFFSLLQQQMRLHLLPYYPELKIGFYNHYIISAHIYEKNFKDIKKMLNTVFEKSSTPMLTENIIDETGKCLIDKNRTDNFCKELLKHVSL